VLDPFIGSGTVAIAAETHGRDWLGIELNPDYAALAEQRIAEWRTKHERKQQRIVKGGFDHYGTRTTPTQWR
jgi:site-specific DNA-methyltransferase (adenine-specific)